MKKQGAKKARRRKSVGRATRSRPALVANKVRGPLHVSATHIASLSSQALLDLVSTLAHAEGGRLGIAPTKILFGGAEKAPDGGGDGLTPAHGGQSAWLPVGLTVWQLKAGKAGQPAKLRAELLDIQKPEPARTLKRKGHYIVVASGSVSGENGRSDRLKALREAARERKLPADKIDVYTSEVLSRWVDELPSVARSVLESPGAWTTEDWEASAQREHGMSFRPSPTQATQMDSLAKLLDLSLDAPSHLHVFGHPGVGKTRLLLETCRLAQLRPLVLYFQESTSDVRNLLARLADREAHGIVVIDETPSAEIGLYADLAGQSRGRLRVVTVGKTLGNQVGVKALRIEPQSRQDMEGIVREWWPEMPPEHRGFVAKFSDGFPRLARLVGEYLLRHPQVTTSQLLEEDLIAKVIKSLLPRVDRRHLYVLAVLETLGFAGEAEGQGELVAESLGVEWLAVKATISELRDEYGLVRMGQDFLYLSPLPLALALAQEAWHSFPTQLKKLRDELPDDAAQALDRRLSEIGGSPKGAALFTREITSFRALVDFSTERNARLWTILAEGQPELAVVVLRKALEGASKEERLGFSGGPRRAIVWYLAKLVWRRETFDDAIKCLAGLGVAENETWGNNATGEFAGHFQIHLAGTEVAYSERLPVLREIFDSGPEYHSLVLRALAKGTDVMVTRSVGAEASGGGALRPEWRPTVIEEREARVLAVNELCTLLPKAAIDEKDAVSLVQATHWTLSNYGFDKQLEELVSVVLARFPHAREPMRRVFSSHLARERWGREHDSKNVETVPGVVRRLEAALRDPSATGRLKEIVGPDPWDTEGTHIEMREIGRELLNDPALLQGELPWLCSGEAGSGFAFGSELAALDEDRVVESSLGDLNELGPDLRFPCGYFIGLASRRGEEWIDAKIDSLVRGGTQARSLAFEILTLLDPSVTRAGHMASLLRAQAIAPTKMRVVAHRPWAIATDDETLFILLDALVSVKSVDARRTALEILGSRLHEGRHLSPQLGPLGFALATDKDVYPAASSFRWGWKEVASELAKGDARRIARFIFALQSDRNNHFFLDHHREAKDVLDVCLEQGPTSVWEALAECLTPGVWSRFSIGLPKRLLARLDASVIMAWVDLSPDQRAPMVAHCVAPLFEAEGDIDSRLVERYIQVDGVGEGLFSNVITGTSWGSLAGRWRSLAETFRGIAQRTTLRKVRRWTSEVAQRLDVMADGEAGREADDAVRRR